MLLHRACGQEARTSQRRAKLLRLSVFCSGRTRLEVPTLITCSQEAHKLNFLWWGTPKLLNELDAPRRPLIAHASS